jgi:hypothetical protein
MALEIVLKLGRLAALAALAAVFAHPASAQTAADPNAAAIAALQTYELPDHTASARLPADWSVVATGVGFIQARGPNGELALFGVMIPATDGSPARLTAGGITQPYASNPERKFLAAIDWIRAHNGKPAVQAQFIGNRQISAPAAFGACSNIIAILDGAVGVETDFCSLPEDSSGHYRDFFKAVGLPLRDAEQERSLMEAILASYRLNLQAIQAQHAAAPANPAPSGSVSATVSAENSLIAGQLMMQEANAINAETFAGMQGVDNSVSNFDHGILRGQTPIYAAGMPQPVFWVGD